jgi:hypothetical protein
MSGDKQELVDDLADVLAHMVVGWKNVIGVDLAEHPEVVRVMARYREAKAIHDQLVITLQIKAEEVAAVFDHAKGGDLWSQWADVGRMVEQDCNVYGSSVWQRIEGVIRRADPASVVFHVQ